MKSKILYIVLTGFFLVQFGINVSAQTGSRVGSNAYPTTITWFNNPDEVDEVRRLLQEGKAQQAVELARKFLRSLNNVNAINTFQYRYAGLNALCAALTRTGDLNEAIDTCTRAIDIIPGHWQAVNSRGTAYYVSGQYQSALEDYRQALNLGSDSDLVAELIQHNIRLAEVKLAPAN